jgi:hypothetical protein
MLPIISVVRSGCSRMSTITVNTADSTTINVMTTFLACMLQEVIATLEIAAGIKSTNRRTII